MPNRNPCKDNKCISYPVCISKDEIDCTSLDEWYLELEKFYKDKKNRFTCDKRVVEYIWGDLKPILPKLRIIIGITRLALKGDRDDLR